MKLIDEWAGWLSHWRPTEPELPDAVACDPLSHPVLSRMNPDELADLPFPRLQREHGQTGKGHPCGMAG